MRKAISKTKVSVRLRKSEYKDEWYLYLEAYPVYEIGKSKPIRLREYVNRSITTPIWDKAKVAKTTTTSKSYRPKRDENGIIQCKANIDRESCIFADNVRKIRQSEYDTASLYSEMDTEQAAVNERMQDNFIEYFEATIVKRHKRSSKSIIINWKKVAERLRSFAGGDVILFSQISTKLVEAFREYLLSAPFAGKRKGTLSQNTAATYFAIFKAAIKQAFNDGYLAVDIASKVKGIQEVESKREYLTMNELNALASTPCEKPVLKQAAIFSALTGLRHCDIQKLKWSEIENDGETIKIKFTQQKTKGVEYMPISEQAYSLCGEPKSKDSLVFEDLTDSAWISKPLKRWVESAGITKKITFHCFRHTYATLQLAGGTDIYTVSKMLGHTNVKTTQVYAKVVDESKNKAANVIKLDIDPE